MTFLVISQMRMRVRPQQITDRYLPRPRWNTTPLSPAFLPTVAPLRALCPLPTAPPRLVTCPSLLLPLPQAALRMPRRRLSGNYPLWSLVHSRRDERSDNVMPGWASLSPGWMRTSSRVSSFLQLARLSMSRSSATRTPGTYLHTPVRQLPSHCPDQPRSGPTAVYSHWIILKGEKLTIVSLLFSNAGYCFVEFPTPDAANKALQLNGSSVPNSSRQFKLNWASGGGLVDRR